MAEPEDLIIDGAHATTRLVRGVWRRYVPPTAPAVVRLADIRLRLECFLQALFKTPLAVTTGDPAAPVSWLARLAGRGGDADAGVMAGTDGARIYLPPSLDLSPALEATAGAEAAIEKYRLLAVGQAIRLLRESVSLLRRVEDPRVRDHYLLAEAVAADDWVCRTTPGLVSALRAVRRQALDDRITSRTPLGSADGTEARVRGFLAHDPLARYDHVPVCRTASDSLAWAARVSASQPSAPSHRSITPAWYWGRAYAAGSAAGDGPWARDDDAPSPRAQRRVAEMRRRPRVREAAEDEDDHGTGTWVIRTDEPQETVEDPFGLQRPADTAEVDPEGLGDSLAELPEARVVRTPGEAKEVLRAGEMVPRSPVPGRPVAGRGGTAYPEWDFRSGTYRRPGSVVRESVAAVGDASWAASALARHSGLVRRVRTRFMRMRPRRVRVGRQSDGAELDIAEYVNAAADGRAGAVVEDRLYVDVRPGRRELAVGLLVDVSASTDSWVSGQQRIVDVEKEALLVVCEALAALGDRHAIFAFSGEGAEHVSIVAVKGFDEPRAELVRQRIAALEADGYTRVGAALRHMTAALSAQPAGRRLLLLLSDGKPNDVDAYDGPYGIEDARQAVTEARAQGIHVFCVTVDRESPRYAPRIFGAAGYTLLRRPDQLPEVLIDVLRRLVRR